MTYEAPKFEIHTFVAEEALAAVVQSEPTVEDDDLSV